MTVFAIQQEERTKEVKMGNREAMEDAGYFDEEESRELQKTGLRLLEEGHTPGCVNRMLGRGEDCCCYFTKHPKIKEYREKFVEYMHSIGVERECASAVLDSYIKMVGPENLDYNNPKQDADKCMSYWDD